MPKYDFEKTGRGVYMHHPDLFQQLSDHLNAIESQALNNVDQLPVLYESFCAVVGPAPVKNRPKRCTSDVVIHRRLFIAVAVHLYDPLFINNYTARLRDNLRNNIAQALNCCPEWLSASVPSVLFEYKQLCTFQMQTNLIAYYLRMQTTARAA